MFGLSDARVSKQTDIYAFGIVVYEVLTGCPPFGAGGRRQAEIILRVIEGQRPSKPEKAGGIGFGGGTWELTQQCWNQDRGKRPTADKIRKHFHRVAGTSRVIPPGPTVSGRESGHTTASEPDISGSGNFSQCSPSSQPHAKPHLVQTFQPVYSFLLRQVQASFSRSSLLRIS